MAHDLHFLEPTTKHLKNLQIGYVGIVEPWSIHEDEMITIDWMIE